MAEPDVDQEGDAVLLSLSPSLSLSLSLFLFLSPFCPSVHVLRAQSHLDSAPLSPSLTPSHLPFLFLFFSPSLCCILFTPLSSIVSHARTLGKEAAREREQREERGGERARESERER